MDFKDKVVLITGGAGGIGLASAKKFHDYGAKIALVDLNEAALAKAKESLGNGDDIITVAADVSDEAQSENYVKETMAAFGRIDVFVNNAGINGAVESVTEMTAKNIDSVLDINVKGVIWGLKYVLRVMKEQKSGSVINVASIGGWVGSPGMSAYVASKHAVVGITKSVALEVVGDGIRVNAVNPTAVETEMMRSIEANRGGAEAAAIKEQIIQGIPMGRYAQPEEIADLIVYLGSEYSSFITGAYHKIDGGAAATSA